MPRSLMPSIEQVRALREHTSCGLCEAKKSLLRSNITAELDEMAKQPMTVNEERLYAILRAMMNGAVS